MHQPMNNDRLALIYTQNVKQTKISCTKNLRETKDLLSTASVSLKTQVASLQQTFLKINP